MKDIWIEISFDGQPVDNDIVHSTDEAVNLINEITAGGFENYYINDVKEDWISKGFRNNPDVTAKIINN